MKMYHWQVILADGKKKVTRASSVKAITKRLLADRASSTGAEKMREGEIVECDIYRGKDMKTRMKIAHVKRLSEDSKEARRNPGIAVKAGAAVMNYRRAVEDYAELKYNAYQEKKSRKKHKDDDE